MSGVDHEALLRAAAQAKDEARASLARRTAEWDSAVRAAHDDGWTPYRIQRFLGVAQGTVAKSLARTARQLSPGDVV